MVLGNPDGAVTLVEFFDYNCTYCRRAVSDMTALIDANPDLRMVMKEFPILSDGSVEAARISIAVESWRPTTTSHFHLELFSRPGQASAEKALEVANDLGLDTDALKAAANAKDVTARTAGGAPACHRPWHQRHALLRDRRRDRARRRRL